MGYIIRIFALACEITNPGDSMKRYLLTFLALAAFVFASCDTATNAGTDTGNNDTTLTVATPTLSPAGGTFTSSQSVTLACTTEGAAIHYTIDGTAPTGSSPVYSAALTVSSTQTIKAMATKEGMTDSAVASATYTIESPAPGAGTIADPYAITLGTSKSVTLPEWESGNNSTYFFFTVVEAGTYEVSLSGISPTLTDEQGLWWNLYSDSAYSDLLAYEWDIYGDYASSGDLASGTYYLKLMNWEFADVSFTLKVSKVTTAPPTDGYDLTVAIDTVTLDETDGLLDVTYTVTNAGDVDMPGDATFYADLHVGSTNALASSDIMAINAWASSYAARNPANLTAGESVQFTAENVSTALETSLTSGYVWVLVRDLTGEADTTNNSSDYATFAAAVPETVATPTVSPDGGSFTAAQTVTLACDTADAAIYYTINGDTPTSSSTAYTAAFELTSSCTVKAIATKSGMTDSAVASAAFTIDIPASVTSLTAASAITGKTVYGSAAYSEDGTKVYFTSGSALCIYDVSNPASPSLLGTLESLTSFNTNIIVKGNYAYLMTGNDVYVVDVSDSSAPVKVAQLNTMCAEMGAISADGNTLYMAYGDSGKVRAFNVTDKTAAPVPIGSSDFTLTSYYDTGVTITALVLDEANDRLYAAHSQGFGVLDVSDTSAISKVSISCDVGGYNDGTYWNNGFDDIALVGNELYCAAETYFMAFNVGNIAAITRDAYADVDLFDEENTGIDRANNIYVDAANHRVYLGDFDNGMYVLDVSTLSAPTLAANYLVSVYYNTLCVSPDFSSAIMLRGSTATGHVLFDLGQLD